MEQKKPKKSGIFNALKTRFWTGNISGKSCFKKRGSKLKSKTESSHCNSFSCDNQADITLDEAPGNTSDGAGNMKISASEPTIVSDIRRSIENSRTNETEVANSTIEELLQHNTPEGRLQDNPIYFEPRTSEHHTQDSASNSVTRTSNKSIDSPLTLSASQPLVDNEACSETDGNQNQLDSNLKSGLMNELLKLSKCGWYWGNISKEEAEEKLTDQTDGAFLLRDSSADHFLLSLSFRSSGKTLHTRIEYSLGRGLFSFHQQTDESFSSIAELIEHSMYYSKSAVYCYSRPRSPAHPAFPVRLTKPVSRFAHVRSLQHLCRFVIRESIRLDNIQKLPLPPSIKLYIEEGYY